MGIFIPDLSLMIKSLEGRMGKLGLNHGYQYFVESNDRI